jgi:hypothetical protein
MLLIPGRDGLADGWWWIATPERNRPPRWRLGLVHRKNKNCPLFLEGNEYWRWRMIQYSQELGRLCLLQDGLMLPILYAARVRPPELPVEPNSV